jgi:aminoglycoside phosphotransferase (APT) family kinase protein
MSGVLFRVRNRRRLGHLMRRSAGVDWDDAVVGDPAFDVGYFLTYLETDHQPPAGASVIVLHPLSN